MAGYKNSITDIDGKVGIGVSSPATELDIAKDIDAKLRITSTRNGSFVDGDNFGSLEFYGKDASGLGEGIRAAIRAKSDGTFGVNTNLTFSTSNGTTGLDAERMRIDSSGNVAIGASNAYGWRLNLEQTNSQSIRLLNTSGNGTRILMADQSFSGEIEQNSGNLLFKTGGTTERMRINSSGNVLIGTTGIPNGTSIYGAGFISGSDDRRYLNFATSGTVTREHIQFFNPNGKVGTIQTSGSSTSYNTSSDYRLKENVVEMTGALDRVDALKPSRFNFIADPNKTVDGFLAHEVAEVVPEAISGEKDAVEEYEATPAVLDEDGNVIEEAVMGTRPVYQGIDQSKLVPLLVGAIQELRAEIEALKQNSVS